MRYSVGQVGAYLALRQTARDVAEHGEETTSAADVIVLDFTGVEAVSGAFADELVTVVARRSAGHRIRIESASEAVRDTLTTTLERRGLEATWAQTGDGNA